MPKLNIPAASAAPPESPPEAVLAITRREAIPDLSCIPEAVQSYFRSRGYCATLASSHEHSAMQLSTSERYPLSLEEIPDVAEREELRKELRRHGFRIKDEMPQRGDCWIYIQPQEARERVLAQGRSIWLGQDDPASLDESLTEFNKLFGKLNIPQSRATAVDVGRLSDHVAEWGA